jgi:hypothetical protein
MNNWKEQLMTSCYPIEGNGLVFDSVDAEKIALLAYSSGLEKGIAFITDHIKKEMGNPSATLLPMDLPQKIKEHLEEQLNEVRNGRSAPLNPVTD